MLRHGPLVYFNIFVVFILTMAAQYIIYIIDSIVADREDK